MKLLESLLEYITKPEIYIPAIGGAIALAYRTHNKVRDERLAIAREISDIKLKIEALEKKFDQAEDSDEKRDEILNQLTVMLARLDERLEQFWKRI